ncbi:MAG: hypothetical protein JWM86_2465 [Thermoleophilia bacterium]|nr:hypothetical protein [Thermoleophilia bacterium]
MAGINGIGGAAAQMGGGNPLSGMAGSGSGGVGNSPLSGLGDMGLGNGDGGAGSGLGVSPAQGATKAQGASFGDTLRAMVVENPSKSRADATTLSARFAAGEQGIDAHTIAIANAKAGVEIQMATRTISSAVSAVRTLFQMQI